MATQVNTTLAARSTFRSGLWWRGLFAAIAAAAGNLLVWTLAQRLFDLPLLIPAGPGSTELAPLPGGAVVVTSVAPALAATVFLALLYRFVSRPLRVFWVVSALFLLVSFVPLVPLPVDTGTKIVLSLMHVVAAVIIVGLLTAGTRKQ